MNDTQTMTPLEALRRIADQLSEFDSFAEGFDHEFHGDEPDANDNFPSQGMEDYAEGDSFECRFDQAHTAGTFEVLEKLITVAQGVVMAEPDELFEGKLDELAAVLGIVKEEIEDQSDDRYEQDDSGGWVCTVHQSPLFDVNTIPWRCDSVEDGIGKISECSFVDERGEAR